MIQTVSVKDTRKNFADLINQVDITKREFIITKFGKPKAMLVPVKIIKEKKSGRTGLLPGFGAWAGRKDITDSAAWVVKMRSKWTKRYE